MNTEEVVVGKARTAEFKALFQSSMDNLKAACVIYVEDIDVDWEVKFQYEEALPHIPNSAWARFEAIGRGILHPELALMAGPGPRRLITLPMSDQKKYVNTPVNLLMKDGTILKAKVRELNRKQADQAFTINSVRSIEEQKLYLERQAALDATEHTKKYEIVEGRLRVISAGSMFSAAELKHILGEMKKS